MAKAVLCSKNDFPFYNIDPLFQRFSSDLTQPQICLDRSGNPSPSFEDQYFPTGHIISSYSTVSRSDRNLASNSILYEEVLSNGLKILINENHESGDAVVRVYSKYGSYYDDPRFTGTAHFFEHFLTFKGSRKIGTLDWKKENPLLDKIRKVNDQQVKLRCGTPSQRAQAICTSLQSALSDLSVKASQYAIANEAARVFNKIGASQINAATSRDYTYYTMNLAGSAPLAFNKWAKLEGELFSQPVFRNFLAEVKTLYDEKNDSLDNKERQLHDKIDELLFPAHPYGRAVLGSMDHIRNISIRQMEKFYNDYYSPDQMAIIVSGDVDAQATAASIRKYFGHLKKHPTPESKTYRLPPIRRIIEKEIEYSSEEESVGIGFRGASFKSRDHAALLMIDRLLSDKSFGKIHQQLILPQKLKSGTSLIQFLRNGGSFLLTGTPKEKQFLEEVEVELLKLLKSIKDGNFTQEDLDAVARNYEKDISERKEANQTAVDDLGRSFVYEVSPQYRIDLLNELKLLKKDKIQEVAKRYFKVDKDDNNYVVVYQRNRKPKEKEKLENSKLEKINLNEEAESAFAKEILKMPQDVPVLRPIQYGQNGDFKIIPLGPKSNLYYVFNPINSLFDFSVHYQFGKSKKDPAFCIVMEEVSSHPTELSNRQMIDASEVAKRFYAMASAVEYDCGNDSFSIHVKGLKDYFSPSLELVENQLWHSKFDQPLFKGGIQKILQSRIQSESDPLQLRNALFYYAMFDSNSIHSPYLNRASSDSLLSLQNNPQEAYEKRIQELRKQVPQFHYVGPQPIEEVIEIIRRYHPQKLDEFLNKAEFIPRNYRADLKEKVKIYFTENDDHRQAHTMFFILGDNFNSNDSVLNQLVSLYFGDGGELIFNHLREGKGLGYSIGGDFHQANRLGAKNYFYVVTIAQADKTADIVSSVLTLLKDVPVNKINFESNKKILIDRLIRKRYSFREILPQVIEWENQGEKSDTRNRLLQQLETLTFEQFQAYVKNLFERSMRIVVVGKKEEVNPESLKRFGSVEIVQKDQLFQR